MMLVKDLSQEIFNGISFRNSLFANMAGNASDLAVLTDQGPLIVAIAEDMCGGLERSQSNDITWAGLDALSATGTFFTINDGHIFSGHLDCSKRTDLRTRTESQAATRAGLRTIGQLLGRTAIGQAEIVVLYMGFAIIALTQDHGNFWVGGDWSQPHDIGDLIHNQVSARRADIGD